MTYLLFFAAIFTIFNAAPSMADFDWEEQYNSTYPAPCGEEKMSDFFMACGEEYIDTSEDWCDHEDDMLRCVELLYEEDYCESTKKSEMYFQEIFRKHCPKRNPVKRQVNNGHDWLIVVVLLLSVSLLLPTLLAVAQRTKPQEQATTTVLTLRGV